MEKNRSEYEQMFEANVGLVYDVYMKQYCKYATLKDDLVQEGLIGLWKAAQTFDCTRGVQFSTYAYKCIRNQMEMFMRKERRHSSVLVCLDKMVDESEGGCPFLDVIPCGEEVGIPIVVQAADIVRGTNFEEVVRLKCAGYKQVEIAKKMGISEPYVSELLKAAYVYIKERL